jgi:UDP-glucose 4-epimerase
MNKYLVTGGCGFIGSNLVKTLVKMKSEVIVVDDLSSGKLINLPNSKRVNLIEKAIQDISILEISHIDGIFHLAAQASVPKSIDRFYESSKNNLLSTIKIFDIAKKKKVPIVYASSSAVYGNLALGDEYQNNFDIISPYALDKLTMENYAKLSFKLFNLSSIGLRFFNVYGPNQDPKNPYSGVITIFINNLINNKPIQVNGGFQTRDFIFIDDIVKTLIVSLEKQKVKKCFEILNVGTGKSISINQLLNYLINISGQKPEIIKVKLPPGDPEKSAGNYNKLSELLNIDIKKFVEIDEGLTETFYDYKKIQGIK